MIRINFACDGCDEAAETFAPQRGFISLSGKGYGFGSYKYPTISECAPDGWWAYDPWTGCCYCPKCRADLESEPADERREVEA